MYEKVESTLETLGFRDEYLQLFIDNEVDDSVVQDCLTDPTLASTLADIIRPLGRRVRFLKKFSDELMSSTATNTVPQLDVKTDQDSSTQCILSPKEEVGSRVESTGHLYEPGLTHLMEDLMLKTPATGSSGQFPMETGCSVDEYVGRNNSCGTDVKISSDPASTVTIETPGLSDSAQPPQLSHPVQIMNFQESGEDGEALGVQFYRPNLEKILHKTAGRPVGVLAIAGPTRKGKSFFMNYVLRYLKGLAENDEDWMGWARSKDPLVGFPWETSSDRITTGIWMWSEPICMKSKDGQEYDILLMDTQGVFDEHTSPQQWSVLVGLGLLSSSCLIFNLSSDLQEDQLNIFDKFLQFGLLALQDQTTGPENNVDTPFQKLVFLIRDWSNTQQHPFGSEGGNSFIKKKLEIKVHHKDAHRRVREQLDQCFEEITCFLLPNPGPAAFELGYNGATANCSKYLAELEACISELMNPEAFPVKKLNGNFLTGQDLLDHFTLYCNLLSSDEMPSSESFYDIASRSCNSVVINKCIETAHQDLQQILASREFFQDEVLVQLEGTIQEKALQIYASCKKMGTKESIEQSKQDLLAKVSAMFGSVKSTNAHKKDKAISSATDAAINSYTARMQEILSLDFRTSDFVETVSIDEEESAMKLFAQLCYLEDSEEFPAEKANLSRSLKQKLDGFQQSNTLNRLEAEKKLETKVDFLATSYRHEMEFKTDGTIISDVELDEMHKSTWQKCLSSFSDLKPHSLLYADAEENLKKKVNTYFEGIERSVKTCNDNIQMVGEQLKAIALKDYRTEMRKEMGIKEVDFENLHCDVKEYVMEGMGNSDRIKSKKCMKMFLQQVDAEIEDAYLELREELLKFREDLKNKRQTAKLDAVSKYVECMNKLFADAAQSPIQELKLQNRHEYAESEAVAFLDNFFEDLSDNCRDEEEEEVVSEELSEEINAKYILFQENNELRWDKFESQARNTLSTIKEEYVSSLRGAIEDAFEEDEFFGSAEEAQRSCKSQLGLRIDTNIAKPDFLEGLQKELHNYIQAQFNSLLDVFRMKQEEDEIQVKAAFLEAKKHYNDEMDKVTHEQDWYPPDVLTQKSKEKADAAIDSCKEEVELTDHQEKQLREHMKNLFVKYWNANLLRYPRESYSVGIDLGTTYSCVAVCMNKQVKVIEYNGKTTIPSVVAFNDDRGVDVGQAAKDQYYRHPENTIFDAKRLIGRKFTDRVVQEDIKLWPFNVIGDENDQPKMKVRGMELRPEEISARILARLKNVAEEYLLKPVLEAVVTVPAYFNDAQRQATRDAAEIAGLKVRILNEPTAAAIAYGLDAPDDISRNVLIFDLGGGTFDVAVLQMKAGRIDVKATGGDTHLGGEDFDNEMVKYIIDHIIIKDGIDLGRDRTSTDEFKKRKAFARLGRIRHYCEEQKRTLSSAHKTYVSIDRIDDNYDLHVEFTRGLFEQLNMPRFTQCIRLMADVLEESRLDKSDINDIVLVGGSTRIPKIREMIQEFFNNKALNKRINPDEAVARGAAVQAALLNGKQAVELAERLTLSDVAPLSVGVEVVTGALSVVIPKNTPVPCMRSEIFHTASDNQTSANIKVYEGEKPMALENNFLGKFLLSNIPKAPRGKEPIDINMTVDAEGILHVQAVSRSSRSTNGIDIETYNGRMTNSEISKARRDGLFRW